MNTMIKTLSLAVVGSLITVAGAQAAGFAGASSDTNHIIIQPTGSNGPHHTVSGDVGIRVKSATGVFGQLTMGLPAYKHFTQNQVVQGYEVSTLNANTLPPNHRSLGNFDFVQVPDQEVYFGEWTANRSNPNPTHTVYYGGKNRTTSTPMAGSAKYSIKGINNFDGQNLLSGELEADFFTNSFRGNLQNSKLKITMSGGLGADANFNGTANATVTKTNGTTQRLRGKTSGNFFGHEANSVAGIATFRGHKEADTAFGGKATYIDPGYSNPYEPIPVLEVKK